jgi:ABC-type sugar transport system ATPase subunit
MEKIRFENVKKKYLYGADALNGVSFSLEKNRRMTLFGDAGAGKTTLLKIVAGLTDFEGGVYLDGADIRKIPIKDRRISMTFSDAFKSRKSVYENLYFSFKIRGIEAKIFEEKLRKIDEIFGVGYLYFWSFKDLNQRQKAIVTVLRCLIRDADLYLLDNPLKGLPINEKRDFILKMLSYLGGERTLIYSTDDLDEARLLNFDTLILNCGYISDAGLLEDMRKAPAELSVCRLFGFNIFKIGGEYIAIKPEELIFKKSENPTDKPPLDGVDCEKSVSVRSGLDARFDGESEFAGVEFKRPENGTIFYTFGASAKLIGMESGSAYNTYNFASLDDSQGFFSVYIFHANGGSIPPKIGDIYELFYDKTKALRYGAHDEKLIKRKEDI